MTPARRRRLTITISVAVLAVIALIVVLTLVLSRSDGPPADGPVPVPPRADAPERARGSEPTVDGIAGLVDVAWAQQVSAATGIPLRALQAYAGVAIAKRAENPGCNLGWNTLAGIGDAESSHGQHDGSGIDLDGTVDPPIHGIVLDGADVDRIPDSDGGAIDGDAEWDRAVGPMQFIPESWRNWGTDASGDGVADPQNIDDATLATANYLCRAGGDLGVPDNWRKAIASYNSAPSYSAAVSSVAIRYAK